MYEISTLQSRIDMAQARAGNSPLPIVTHIALGSGGHAAGDTNTPIQPTDENIPLENEVVRKMVTTTFPNTTTVRYSCTLDKTENNGVVFTEACLYDNNENVVAKKTFSGKTKDADIIFQFDWDETF